MPAGGHGWHVCGQTSTNGYACRYRELGRPTAGVRLNLKVFGRWDGDVVSNVSSSIAIPTAGPGYFLAGDAASIVDPLSSHGTLKALMSGMKAAHYSATVLRYGVSPRPVASAYHLWLARWFRQDRSGVGELYRA